MHGPSATSAAIRRLAPADAARYHALRNQGLAEFPDAFTTSHSEGLATPLDKLAQRIAGHGDDFVLGAFAADDALAGFAGFRRGDRAKTRHNGKIVGMYVAAAYRGTGLGKALLERLIDEVRAIDGMEILSLTVTHSNRAAREMYVSAGFVPFGIERRALKVGADYFDKEHMALALR